MKTPRIANALNQVDEDIVSGAARAKKVKKNNWLKWGSIAACFVVMLAAMLTVMPMLFEEDSPVVPPDNGPVNEGAVNDSGIAEGKLEKYYDYEITSGAFVTYINGKVIDAEKIGAKLESVTVTGGWKNEAGEWISTEALNADVYAIEGVSSDVAVALKFVDQGEAVTTTHYYVIMNPNADLTAVEDYIIAPIVPNNPGDEMAGEVNE